MKVELYFDTEGLTADQTSQIMAAVTELPIRPNQTVYSDGDSVIHTYAPEITSALVGLLVFNLLTYLRKKSHR